MTAGRRLAALALIASASPGLAARAAEAAKTPPPLILLQTSAGDMVARLFPGLAPRHVAQFLKLVEAGVYDGMRFHRVEPGFVAQVSTQYDRISPLTPEQKALIRPIPAEFSKRRLHRRGVLSMARGEDIDSAEVSFSILLGEAPHLDGQYTAFGEIIRGTEVLDEIEKAQVSSASVPLTRLSLIRAARIWAAEPSRLSLNPPRPLPVIDQRPPLRFILAASLVQLLIGAAIFFGGVGAWRWSPRTTRSLGLGAALVSGFTGCVLLFPSIRVGDPAAGVAMFLTMLFLFRLMSRFESQVAPPAPASAPAKKPASVIPFKRKRGAS